MIWGVRGKGERPVGVPTARGHGVMEVQRFGAYAGSELVMILPAAFARVDRPKGSIRPGTFVLWRSFAGRSLAQQGLPTATRGDTLGSVMQRERGV
jgi:hypothetical protein